MHTTDQAHRVIFIDLMRAIAVLQMVQGHTIDVLLAQNFRTAEFPVFAIWNFLRGMTAPIFMFTAGTVFTYLFHSVKKPFEKNYRVKKGIRRGVLLIFLGYMLKYPTWKLFDFSEVTQEKWSLFLSVDVLQLIGVGLLIVILLLFIAEKLELNFTTVFIVISTLVFVSSPFFETIDWKSILPEIIVAYLYSGTGSLFPLFPWSGYVIAGGVLGCYLSQNPLVFKTTRFSILLAIFGAAFTLIALLSNKILYALQIHILNPQTEPSTIFYRMGFVLLLTAIVSYISLRVNKIPQIIILAGRNTLLIYVVHLIILFGSAWSPGIDLLWGYSFSGWQSFFAALLMIILMTIMVLVIHKFKIRNKDLVT
jgi:uncharacterized membrane protein